VGLDVVDFNSGNAEGEHDLFLGDLALMFAPGGGAPGDDDDGGSGGQPAAVSPAGRRLAAAHSVQDATGEAGRRVNASERILEFLF